MKLRVGVIAALVLGGLPVASGALTSVACASEGPRAVLVVDTGAGAHRFCVSLPRSQVSGIDLIRLASQQHGLQYRLGFGGNAVCQLAGVGPEGDDCFADDPYFWGYWRGDGSGGWTWSSSGAGSTAVRNGSVDGWSWGTGRDGSSHPKPPGTAFASVCPASPPPADDRGDAPDREARAGPRSGARTRGAAEPVAGPSSSDEGRGGPRKKEGKRERNDRRRLAAAGAAAVRADGAKSPGRSRSIASVGSPLSAAGEAPEGPPRAGLAALAAGLLVTVAAALLARRRSRPTGSEP